MSTTSTLSSAPMIDFIGLDEKDIEAVNEFIRNLKESKNKALTADVKTHKVTAPAANTTNNKSKKNLTSYWGVEFSSDTTKALFEHPTIVQFLSEHSELIPLKKVHSTLLYVGKKENSDELVFKEFENRSCIVTIDGFGFSLDAMALRVEKIQCDDEFKTNVPTFAIQQHVTMALRTGVAAKDSVKTLIDTENKPPISGFKTGNIVPFAFTLNGIVKRFLY